MLKSLARPEFFTLHNGGKAPLPFSQAEYANRLAKLRRIMADAGVDAAVLTSMHNVAYYSGFLYCSFGRPYACVVTPDRCVTVSANIDGGQPLASIGRRERDLHRLDPRQLLARRSWNRRGR